MSPVRSMIAGGIFFSALRAVLAWATPWPLKLIFDNVLSNHRLPSALAWLPHSHLERLNLLVLATVVIAVALGFASYGADALLANAGQKIVFDLRCRLFGHVQRQQLSFHFKNTVGDLLARLGGDVQAMQGVVVNVIPVLVENVLTVSGMVVIMFVLDWRYSLIMLSLVPALFFTVRHYLSAIKKIQRKARNNEGEASAVAQEVLVGLPVVQAFGAEQREADRYGALAMLGLDASKRAVLLQSRFTPIVTTTMTVSTALVLLFGARAVVSGRLTTGDLIVFIAYLRGIYTPVRQIAKVAGMLGRGQASADRVLEILNTHEEVKQIPNPQPFTSAGGAISFEGVKYSYPGSDSQVLKGVSIEVRAGTRHALVGSTGSGKSTLLRLVPRFIDPTAGRVMLGNVNVAHLDLKELRANIALVPQEPTLLGGTVWENIAYGFEIPSRSAAVAAARNAGVHEVLGSLREGYDTLVGERGSGLSGGQRQCVAVARAMARNASIILLDEPTTGLDAQTETVLLEALNRLCEGRTSVFVTHHLAAIQDADAITVLAHGQVVEQGKHQELLGARGTYWMLQQSGVHISVQSDASSAIR